MLRGVLTENFQSDLTEYYSGPKQSISRSLYTGYFSVFLNAKRSASTLERGLLVLQSFFGFEQMFPPLLMSLLLACGSVPQLMSPERKLTEKNVVKIGEAER